MNNIETRFFTITKSFKRILDAAMKKPVLALTILGLIVVAISIYIHDPATPIPLNNYGFKYTDIVQGVLSRIVSIDKCIRAEASISVSDWYHSKSLAMFCRGEKVVVLPYVDYKFEYPPLVALTWIASLTIARAIVKGDLTNIDVYSSFERIHYYVHAVILSISYIFVIIYSIKLLNRLGQKEKHKLILLCLSPSIILYLIYNWDIIAAMFVLLGILDFCNSRCTRSGIWLSLATLTKLYPAFLFLVFAYELFQRYLHTKNRDAMKNVVNFVLVYGLIALTPFIVLALSAPQGIIDFIRHHSEWYCENCIYQVFIQDIYSPYHKVLYYSILTVVVLIIMALRMDNPVSIARVSLAMLLFAISLSYIFSPQMLLILAPLAIIVLSGRDLLVYIIADIANFGILALFFLDSYIRSLLGLTPKFNPWTADSPVQWLAILRDTLLILLASYTVYGVYRHSHDKSSQL